MGTNLKVEINGKPMQNRKLAQRLEKNMVTAITEGIKGVTTTMTKVDIGAEMLASTLS